MTQKKTIPVKPKQPLKVGRPRKVETPEDLLALWNEFVERQKNHPIVKLVKFTTDKGESMREEYIEQPLFIGDFTDYINVAERYFDDLPPEFSDVISIIKRQCATQKLKGAMSGIYVSNIVAQHLGMANRVDVTTKGDKITKTSEELKEEIKELLRKNDGII